MGHEDSAPNNPVSAGLTGLLFWGGSGLNGVDLSIAFCTILS